MENERDEGWTPAKYAECRVPGPNGEIMWMDDIHVRLLYDVMMACEFKHVVEVGCWEGYSTSALVEAGYTELPVNRPQTMRVTCIDVAHRSKLLRVVQGTPVSMLLGRSVDLLKECGEPDCIVLDGDHSLGNVKAEFDEIMKIPSVTTIIAHDVGVISGDHGPKWLRSILSCILSHEWTVFVDEAARPGMWTERGFLLATQDPAVRDAVAPLFASMPDGKNPTVDEIAAANNDAVVGPRMVNVILPTKRPFLACCSIESIIRLANNPSRVRITIAIDEGDPENARNIIGPFLKDTPCHIAFVEVPVPFNCGLAANACTMAGEVNMNWNDDCVMMTRNWDQIALTVPNGMLGGVADVFTSCNYGMFGFFVFSPGWIEKYG